MKLLSARTHLDKEPNMVNIDEYVKSTKDSNIFYFDKDNSHKDMMNMIDFFESKKFHVYFREIKYGLSEDEYMYEVHIIK